MKDAHLGLRDGTRIEHERLDGLFAAFDLSAADSYRRFLSAHAQAVLPIEATLDAANASDVIADWPARKRGADLIRDLRAMDGQIPEPIAQAQLPGLEEADTRPFAIAGAIYVLEGSRLGGRFLARQVGEGFAHDYLDPNQSPGHWRALLARLEVILDRPDKLAVAINTARSVFATFHSAGSNWLLKE